MTNNGPHRIMIFSIKKNPMDGNLVAYPVNLSSKQFESIISIIESEKISVSDKILLETPMYLKSKKQKNSNNGENKQ